MRLVRDSAGDKDGNHIAVVNAMATTILFMCVTRCLCHIFMYICVYEIKSDVASTRND